MTTMRYPGMDAPVSARLSLATSAHAPLHIIQMCATTPGQHRLKLLASMAPDRSTWSTQH